jgi:putative GTP pyrophosphokinase
MATVDVGLRGAHRDATTLSVRPEDLEELYHAHSRAEYELQLHQILGEVKTVLNRLLVKCQVQYRVKSFAEYHRKWTSLGTPIGDMLGVRIVCPFLDDVLTVENALLESLSIAEVDRKAEQHSFREFGYDSTHLVLDLNRATIAHPLPGVAPVCEIQIRTVLQDAWAEVEHQLIYKSDWSIPTDQIRRKLAALNANLTLSDLIFQELRDLQKDVQTKQERRRDLEAAQGRIVPALESEALGAQLSASPEDAERLDLDQLLLRALTAHAEGALGGAVQLYSMVLTRPVTDPIRAVIFNHRGMAYFALGETNAARADFEMALELDATSYRALHNLGLTCRALGDPRRALDAFRRAGELEPGRFESRAQIVRCLLDLGDVASARQALVSLEAAHATRPELVELLEAVAVLDAGEK